MRVALDAGHGLNTPGKRTPDGEREWSFNNKVVRAITERLNNYEDVSIVRLDDPTGKRDVPLKERTDKANKAKADILVSVHHNAKSGRWGSWGGTETYSYTANLPQAEKLAKMINDRVVSINGLRNRGTKKANFHMLRESNMTAVLPELGFMDSTTDIKVMRDDNMLKKIGYGIADEIAEYGKLKLKKVDKELYRVQTGAFSNKDNADRLAKKLEKAGFDTYIVKY
jgi:N-acetylmuramoyl-L-alanine amidase